MKSYLKNNRYLLLCTLAIVLVQLVGTLLYGDSRISLLIVASSAVYKISSWLFLIGFVVLNLVIGLIYWKTEQRKPINSIFKSLHVSLTIITTFIMLLLVSFKLLMQQSLLITIYPYFPFIGSDSNIISILTLIFFVSQLLFAVYLISAAFLSKK